MGIFLRSAPGRMKDPGALPIFKPSLGGFPGFRASSTDSLEGPRMKNSILSITWFAGILTAAAAPPLSGELELRNTIQLSADLSLTANTTYNPRLFDGSIFATQITVPGFARYAGDPLTPELLSPGAPEHRMVAPFRGASSGVYLLAASGASTSTFSRYDFAGGNGFDVPVPGSGQAAESFDWVDDNTIIYTTYNPSANRRRLSLAKVVAEPFTATADTRWNADGYISTTVSTRIRNVRKGDVYSGFAYYGDGGQNANPQFFALNLATGAETALGNAGTLTGSGSFGVWTVVERRGYLYVQTTDNGIQIYNMTSGSSQGTLYATYAKDALDSLTGYTGQYYGMDVSPDGTRLVLGSSQGNVFELASVVPSPLSLDIARSGNDIILSWPATITGGVIEAAPGGAPLVWSALDPQPAVTVIQGLNTVTLPRTIPARFFRLKK